MCRVQTLPASQKGNAKGQELVIWSIKKRSSRGCPLMNRLRGVQAIASNAREAELGKQDFAH